jgi:phenylpyruvate tautomerase PptA (4-oxalocrotonate tautomerase family)
MPMIDLTLPEGALTPEALDEALVKLGEALLRHEGAPVNRRTRGLSWQFVHELPAKAIRVGGITVDDKPIYRLLVTVPAGTLLQGLGPVGATSRKNLVREVTEIVLAAEGTEYTPEESVRVMCLIREVDDGFWGGFGTTLRIEDIMAVAGPEMGDTELAGRIRAAAEPMLDLQFGREPTETTAG